MSIDRMKNFSFLIFWLEYNHDLIIFIFASVQYYNPVHSIDIFPLNSNIFSEFKINNVEPTLIL